MADPVFLEFSCTVQEYQELSRQVEEFKPDYHFYVPPEGRFSAWVLGQLSPELMRGRAFYAFQNKDQAMLFKLTVEGPR